MQVPSNQDFAAEVKTERLVTLWRVTLGAAIVMIWILLSLSMMQRIEVSTWITALVVLVIGCIATRQMIRANRFNAGAWAYSLGTLCAIAIALRSGNPTVIQILPFAFPVVIFIIGLLLPPATTFLLTVAAAAVTLIVPASALGSSEFIGTHQGAAVLLMFLSALLAAQVTGELFQVTEWALSNYQRERRTSGELFENRTLLERSLHRSEALSDNLKETNELLEAARATAEEAKHFRGQFLANMSHELRTPLNAIIGFSETMLKFPMMYDGIGLPEAYEADLQQIYTSGRQLLGLINDILDLSKVDAGKLEIQLDKVELKPIINGVMATASGLIGERKIKIEADLPEHIPAVWADDARVRQVLLNLYSNAAKFTDKGSITLSVREVEDGIRLSVRDTGSGIPASDLDVIFEEFKQAENKGRDPRSGAGLGLAISRQLLTLMGGRIWAESEPGKGSTFHFVLTKYEEGMTQPVPEHEPTPLSSDRSLRVIREPEGQEVG